MIEVSYSGHRNTDGDFEILSFWPEGAGSLPDGGFDVDAWEDAQVCISMSPGINARAAWKAAYRLLRHRARQAGGLEWEIPSHLGGVVPFPDSQIRQGVACAYR